MGHKILFLVVFSTLFTSSLLAEFDPMSGATCADLVRHLFHLTNAANSGISLNRNSFPEDITIAHVDWQPGQHGGQLETIKRVGDWWGSTAQANGFDPQGDPRWFIYMLGEKAATYFGFKVAQNNRYMTIPDAQELNNAFASINEILQSGRVEFTIDDRFYEQTVHSLEVYLHQYAQHMALPLATNHPSRSHDLAFHLVSIFLPNSVKRKAMKLNQIILDFINHVEQKYSETALQDQVKIWASIMRHIRTRQIDDGTGVFISYLNQFLKSNDATVLSYPIFEMLGYNLDTAIDTNNIEKIFRSWNNKDAIEKIFMLSIGLKNSTADNFPKNFDAKLAQIKDLMGDEKFYKIFIDWQMHYEKHDPTYNTNYLPTLRELCLHMAQKRRLIIEIVNK